MTLCALLWACVVAPQQDRSSEQSVPAPRRTQASASGPGLVDLYGQEVHPLASARRPVVLLFAAVECPFTSDYAGEIQRLAADYGREADFWIVYTDARAGVADLREHARAQGYRVRIARDTEQSFARLAGIEVTPEAAVFSGAGELVYSGRIDDRWLDRDHARSAPTVRDLERVLLALLAGTALERMRTRAVGSPLPSGR